MKLKFLASVFFSLIFVFWPLTVAKADMPGLKVEVYTYDPSALPERVPYELCETDTVWTSAPNIDTNFDAEFGGIVAGCQGDFVLVHYSGYLTSPESSIIVFQSWADDGFYMTLDDQVVIDNWWLKGCGGDSVIFPMSANQSYKFDAWFYEYGGGACNHLFWTAGGEGLVPIPASAFTSDPVAPPIPVTPSLNVPFNVSAVEQADGVRVDWGYYRTDTPLERFAVFYSWGDNAGFGVAATDISTVLTGLPADTDITIKVRADNDSLGVYSDFSAPIVFHTAKAVITPPEPPQPPIDPIPDPVTPPSEPDTPAPTPDPTPTPEPAVEPSTPDVPIIDSPTPAEAHQQLLDQLMEQAQADDITVPENIASIPVFGQTAVAVINAINFMGNVGADMSPTVREKAKKEIVAAVVVTQVAQFSTQNAIASASVAGGSPRLRKISK